MVEVLLNKPPWLMSIIYANPILLHRDTLLNNLRNIKDNYNGSWFVGGNFNDIICQANKCGRIPINWTRTNRYVNCTRYCGLTYLGFIESRYTCYNHRFGRGLILERIDRCFENHF